MKKGKWVIIGRRLSERFSGLLFVAIGMSVMGLMLMWSMPRLYNDRQTLPPQEVVQVHTVDPQVLQNSIEVIKKRQRDKEAAEAARQQALLDEQQRLQDEQERLAAEKKVLEEQELRQKEEERQRQVEAARLAKEKKALEAEKATLAKAEAARKAKVEAERKAKAEAERKGKAEAERKAKEEAERKAKAEAERKAKAEAERKAKAEAERKAKAEAERKAKEEAEAAERAALMAQEQISNMGRIFEQRIHRNWRLPASIPTGLSAEVLIRIDQQGKVIDVKILRGSGYPLFDQAMERAIYQASPFPMPSHPQAVAALVDEGLKITFKP